MNDEQGCTCARVSQGRYGLQRRISDRNCPVHSRSGEKSRPASRNRLLDDDAWFAFVFMFFGMGLGACLLYVILLAVGVFG